MKPIALSILAVFAAIALAACGAGSTQTYEYPSISMEPTISYHEQVTIDLDAYEHSAPTVGDIVAFHPPAGAENAGMQCGAAGYPRSQPCPRATSDSSSQTYIKRIVAGPGDELSIRDGLPVLNGKTTFSHVIQSCSGEGCNLPKSITVPPGHYFLMGDNSRASDDSRYWGPIPRAAIFGGLED